MPAPMTSSARAMRVPVVVGAQPSHRSRTPYQKRPRVDRGVARRRRGGQPGGDDAVADRPHPEHLEVAHERPDPLEQRVLELLVAHDRRGDAGREHGDPDEQEPGGRHGHADLEHAVADPAVDDDDGDRRGAARRRAGCRPAGRTPRPRSTAPCRGCWCRGRRGTGRGPVGMLAATSGLEIWRLPASTPSDWLRFTTRSVPSAVKSDWWASSIALRNACLNAGVCMTFSTTGRITARKPPSWAGPFWMTASVTWMAISWRTAGESSSLVVRLAKVCLSKRVWSAQPTNRPAEQREAQRHGEHGGDEATDIGRRCRRAAPSVGGSAAPASPVLSVLSPVTADPPVVTWPVTLAQGAGRLEPMSWLLLVLGVLSLAFVVNAFVPVRRNVWLFLPSFMASWLAIELAWLNLVVDLVLTALLVWAGALDHWPGWVGLVLSVVSWVLLARHHRLVPGHVAGGRRRAGRGRGDRRPRTRATRSPAPATCPSPGWAAGCSSSTSSPRPTRRRPVRGARPCSRSTAGPGSSATSASRASRC